MDSSDGKVQRMEPRAPRYVLNVKDKKVLRFVKHSQKQQSFFTEILNLSETGMAFTCPILGAPSEGEAVMIEFTPPGGQTMACHAKVMRVQNYTSQEAEVRRKQVKMVGVKFLKLEPAYRKMIRKGLQKEFRHLQSRYRWTRWYYDIRLFFFRNRPLVFLCIGVIALMLVSVLFL